MYKYGHYRYVIIIITEKFIITVARTLYKNKIHV